MVCASHRELVIVIKDCHLVVYMENVTVEEQRHILQGPPQILSYNKIKVMLKLICISHYT